MRLTILILLVILTSPTWAQSIKGTVLDDLGDPLTGAYVSHPRSGHHEHTDIQGRFEIDGVTIGDSLTVSFVGFESESVMITDIDQEITIMLNVKVNMLSEVRIRPRAELGDIINELDLLTRPVTNSQLVLRKVPGLFIAQHAGGGKAEQIFLRGFDIDHGTDVAIDVNGMPVNMVSHAHGQGYSDLHFIIAETLDRIDFDKGGYRADVGNFSTAGSISLKTKNRLQRSSLRLEGGQFNTSRISGLFKLADEMDHGGYIALERTASDGPFESPQDLQRTNLQLHYDLRLNKRNHLDATVSHFTSKWDASGQVPQRAIDQGLITRFGAIDDTEGGETSRSDINLILDSELDESWSLRNSFSASLYKFDLFSNFTFFLAEPENGDQIRQTESRSLFSWRSEIRHPMDVGSWQTEVLAGISWRYDEIDGSALSRTVGRDSLLRRLSYADMEENNQAAYAEWRWSKGRLTLTPGIRMDRFDFVWRNKISNPVVKQSRSDYAISPKMRLDFVQSDKLKYYLNLGQSFHSNDMRMTMERRATAGALPASTGADLGMIWKPSPNVFLQVAAWYLALEQEFVYVGDEAVVEPSGETERRGLDLSTRILLAKNWIIDIDATYSYARASTEEENNDFIPLAPEWTATGGISYSSPLGWSGSLYSRFLADRPANESNTVIATGYFLLDADIGYGWNKARVFLRMENLLDTDWEEAQFLTQSRLQGEPEEGVEEIHFTPGTPFAIYGGISLKF